MTEHDRWVAMHLHEMRAERRQRRTIISGIGARLRSAVTDEVGERILYGPTGRPVRVIEYEDGNAIEEIDDRRHAVVRPSAHIRVRGPEAERIRHAVLRWLRTREENRRHG